MSLLIHHIPAVPKDGTKPAYPERWWLLDEDTKPLNVEGNVQAYERPVKSSTSNRTPARTSAVALTTLHDARLSAAQKDCVR
jgi:hypothetical protein